MHIPIIGCCVFSLIQSILLIAIVAVFLGLLLLFITTHDKTPIVNRYPTEKFFCNPFNDETQEFPFNLTNGDLSLSLVVPAYNEEERLPIMLDETLEFLEDRQKSDSSFTYEIIIVDDGSKDKTTEVGLRYSKKYGSEKIRVLTFYKNRGKGGAVRMGVFCSRGRKILMVDADGATKFSDLQHVEKSLDSLQGGKNGMALCVGSRAHLQSDAVAQRSFFRNVLMYGFHFLVSFFCVKDVKDTQCGFKLFTRKAAMTLFSSLHVERWAFDVELLYIAQQLGIPIEERAVNWEEIDGSKMVPVFSWIQMGKDLVLIRARYFIGAWALHPSGTPNLVDVAED